MLLGRFCCGPYCRSNGLHFCPRILRRPQPGAAVRGPVIIQLPLNAPKLPGYRKEVDPILANFE